MGAIGGICRWDGHAIDPTVLARMARRLDWLGRDQQGFLTDQQAGVVQHVMATGPKIAAESPFRCLRTGCLIAADARIDNREELAATLATHSAGPIRTDTELILAAYLRWGEEVPKKLIGDFSFAIWDPRQHFFFCARDRMGVRPLYYLATGDQFACASHPAALLALPGVSPRCNERRIACFLLHILPEDTDTFYDAVQRLPPGYALQAGPKGVVLQQYWSPLQVKPLSGGDDQEYASNFRALFMEAVGCRLRNIPTIGSTLSGGLDSSFITCVAAAMRKQEPGDRLHTFSAIFPSLPPSLLARIDERSYMDEVRAACNPVAHELRADQLNPFATLDQDVRSAGQPYFGPNMYLHNGLYQLAAESGIKVFLDGIDGDSVVSHGFERLPHLFLAGKWRSLGREIAGLKETSRSRQSLLRLWWSYSLKPAVKGLIDGMGGVNHFFLDARQRHQVSLLRPEFRKRVGIHALLRQHQRREQAPVLDAAANHRASLAMPFLSHILESCAFFSARYGVETRYPFLDHRLVEFCLSLPSEQKLANGWSRAVQRRAMTGIVPEPVIRRIAKADLGPNYCQGLAMHGGRLLEKDIRPSIEILAEYLDVDRLLPNLEASVRTPHNDPEGAIFFFTVACLTMWLSSAE